jgi:hypothetical protein
MEQILPPLVVCGLLMPIEAGLLPYLGFSSVGARAELPLCAVVLLAAGEVSTLTGAMGAFVFGALADVVYAVHPGVFTLTSLILFVLFRGPLGVDVRGPVSFAVLSGVAVPLQAGIVFGLLAFVGRPLPESPFWPIAVGAILTALVAPLFRWLSDAGTHMMTREDPTLLR